jgi:hypothetical protein
MTIPTWNIMHLFAIQNLLAIDKVLENLVQCMTAVQVAIGIRWTIVEDKSFRTRLGCRV